MTDPINVSEARAALPRLIDRVEAGEEVELSRYGRVVAVLVRPDTLRTRRARVALGRAEEIEDLLQRARTRVWSDDDMLSEERAAELIAELEAGRSR